MILDEVSSDFNNVDCIIEVSSTSKQRKSVSPYKHVSESMKKKVIEALENGTCNRKTAASIFNLSYTKVCLIYNQFLKTGITDNKKAESVIKKIRPEIVQFLYDTLAENCLYTMKELRELVKDKYAIDVGLTTLAKEVKLGFHYNIKRIENGCPAIISSTRMKDRQKYCDMFLELLMNERIMIYFHETEFKVTVRQFHKRPPECDKQTNAMPSVKTNTKSIMAAMTQNQLLHYHASDGPGNRYRTLEYFSGLFDILSQNNIVGSVIIMDQAILSYCDDIVEVTQSAGHEIMFLPLNSAFFNPIEKMFSQWDALIRFKNPKNETELHKFIQCFTEFVTERRCLNYWDHAMYNVSSCINGKLICIT